MAQNTSIEKIYIRIKQEMEGYITFYVEDIQKIFPEMKHSTVYWYISKLVESGYLNRVRKGAYTINEWKGKKKVVLSDAAQKLSMMLDELGFNYFISGVDILLKYMLHVPEQYPIILYVEKNAKEEIASVLHEQGFYVIEPVKLKEQYTDNRLMGIDTAQIVLYATDDFSEAEENIASIEKAFVDLYFAITRNGYPLALQELVRVYQNLIRLGNIDKKKMISVAKKRSIHYDIRFIAESKFITEDAMTFVEILKREE